MPEYSREYSKKIARLHPEDSISNLSQEIPVGRLGVLADNGSTANAQSHVLFMGHEYSPEEYAQAARNLFSYFSILREWAEKEKQVEKKSE